MGRGVVRKINWVRGMVAIETEGDGYTIIELLGCEELELGDRIEWCSDRGGEVFVNRTRGGKLDVVVQNLSVHKSDVDNRLLL